MKILINTHQLKLLASNFQIVEGHGLKSNNILLAESMNEYKVKVFFGRWQTEIRVGAHGAASALIIAKLMFPLGKITSSVKKV